MFNCGRCGKEINFRWGVDKRTLCMECCDSLEAENKRLKEDIGFICPRCNTFIATRDYSISIYADKCVEVERLRGALEDFMSYLNPNRGVSEVPLGPFERTHKILDGKEKPDEV